MKIGLGAWQRQLRDAPKDQRSHAYHGAVFTPDFEGAPSSRPASFSPLVPELKVSTDHGQTWSMPVMFAPPGVHEVNFPTITAGDPGRTAVLFPGSESQDFTDSARPWNMYIVMSVDALGEDPTFSLTVANPKNDPVHCGDCGPGRCDAEDGGSMLDFLDIQVSPTDGAFWGIASDTCVGDCVTDPAAQKLRPGEGVAIRQTKGPSLFLHR